MSGAIDQEILERWHTREVHMLRLDRLDVETNRWNGCHDFSELELVKNRGLASSIETFRSNQANK